MQTRLYIARHGKTMFNTIGRAQGWSDSPLTAEGEQGIHELGIGLREAGIQFCRAYSSDSGRTLLTMGIIMDELGIKGKIPYTYDKRIREWCFGSLDGGYDTDLFNGVLPRIFDKLMQDLTHEEMCQGIYEVDTAGWAEPWPVLRDRIWQGFSAMAQEVEAHGGGNAIVVSHGMTIGTLMGMIDPSLPRSLGLKNGSVCQVLYEDGQFTIEALGDLSYRERGAEVLARGTI